MSSSNLARHFYFYSKQLRSLCSYDSTYASGQSTFCYQTFANYPHAFLSQLKTLSTVQGKNNSEEKICSSYGSQVRAIPHNSFNTSFCRYSTEAVSTHTKLGEDPRSNACVSGRKGAKLDGTLDLDNAQQLFSKLSTGELSKALLNLEVAANELIVDIGTAVLHSPAMKSKILSYPILAAVKHTAYSHFCAGETLEEAAKTLERMWALGLRGILDFSVEDAYDRVTCEQNLMEFIYNINQTRHLPKDSVSFACVKMSALCPLPILERASAVMQWAHRNPNFYPSSIPWLLPSLPVLSPLSPTYHTPTAPEPLSPAEELELLEGYARLVAVCRVSQENGLPLLVDAEYTSVEPIVDHFAYAAAVQFSSSQGSHGLPPVYSTVQCYLKDSRDRLALTLQAARKRGIRFGVKLVRGAYLSRETKAAKEAGAESPIHGSIEETHASYDACAAMMISAVGESVGGKKCQAGVVLATHNYGSGRAAVLKAAEVGLDRSEKLLHFAQLKGMADSLSLGLSSAGYNASKYLPYGPVKDVMPYLIRRAEENRGMIGNTGKERRILRNEIGRRLLAAIGSKGGEKVLQS